MPDTEDAPGGRIESFADLYENMAEEMAASARRMMEQGEKA